MSVGERGLATVLGPALVGLCLVATPARAELGSELELAPALTSSSAESPLGLRVGLFVGEPNGVTLAADASERLLVQLELGHAPRGRLALAAHADVLYAFPELLGAHGGASFEFRIGLGARLLSLEDDAAAVGVRVPIAVAVLVDRRRIEAYAQIAPTIGLHPRLDGTVGGGLGLRVGFE